MDRSDRQMDSRVLARREDEVKHTHNHRRPHHAHHHHPHDQEEDGQGLGPEAPQTLS